MKEAKSMLDYSNAKIDYIKMMIDKIKENDKRFVLKRSPTDDKSSMNLNMLQFESLSNASSDLLKDQIEIQQNDKFKNRFLQFQSKSSSYLPSNASDRSEMVLDEELINLINKEKLFNIRIEELKTRLRFELSVLDGLKSIIVKLQLDKTDKNTIQDAKNKLIESYQKIYLLRTALKLILDKLDSKSSKYASIDTILQLSKNATTDLKTKLNYSLLPTDFNEQIDLNEISKQSLFNLPKTQQICGKLEIKLIGLKDLLTKIERYDSTNFTSKSCSKSSYNINDKISNEIKAVLKLDNETKAMTTYQKISETCFNCLGFFTVELDRNREIGKLILL